MTVRAIALCGAALFLLLLLAVYASALFGWSAFDSVLAPMCHQRSDRCFAIGGHSLAICARCVGIYGSLLVLCARFATRPFQVGKSGWILGLAVALNALDFASEHRGLYGNERELRLALGFFLGGAIALFVFSRTNR